MKSDQLDRIKHIVSHATRERPHGYTVEEDGSVTVFVDADVPETVQRIVQRTCRRRITFVREKPPF